MCALFSVVVLQNGVLAVGVRALIGMIVASFLIVVVRAVQFDCSGDRIAANNEAQYTLSGCAFDTVQQPAGSGGAVWLKPTPESGSSTGISSCTFVSCYASQDGGGFAVEFSEVTSIQSSSGTGCTAGSSGGFAYFNMHVGPAGASGSLAVSGSSATSCDCQHGSISTMIENATPHLGITSTNCSDNTAGGYASGMRLHPHGSLSLQHCRFVSNRHYNVLALFTTSWTQDISCLFFVSNTCGNSGDFRGLIYVEGSHTFTHGVFLNNNIDSGKAIGFGSSGSVTLSNWLIDEQLTTSGNGEVSVTDTGTVRVSGATTPATCPFTIVTPTASQVPAATPARTRTPTPTKTRTPTPTKTRTPTPTKTRTPTPTKSIAPTLAKTISATLAKTISATTAATRTATVVQTPSVTRTETTAMSPSVTRTETKPQTPSRSPVGSPPASPTKSRTFSPSIGFTRSAIRDQSRTLAVTRPLAASFHLHSAPVARSPTLPRTAAFAPPSEQFTASSSWAASSWLHSSRLLVVSQPLTSAAFGKSRTHLSSPTFPASSPCAHSGLKASPWLHSSLQLPASSHLHSAALARSPTLPRTAAFAPPSEHFTASSSWAASPWLHSSRPLVVSQPLTSAAFGKSRAYLSSPTFPVSGPCAHSGLKASPWLHSSLQLPASSHLHSAVLARSPTLPRTAAFAVPSKQFTAASIWNISPWLSSSRWLVASPAWASAVFGKSRAHLSSPMFPASSLCARSRVVRDTAGCGPSAGFDPSQNLSVTEPFAASERIALSGGVVIESDFITRSVRLLTGRLPPSVGSPGSQFPKISKGFWITEDGRISTEPRPSGGLLNSAVLSSMVFGGSELPTFSTNYCFSEPEVSSVVFPLSAAHLASAPRASGGFADSAHLRTLLLEATDWFTLTDALNDSDVIFPTLLIAPSRVAPSERLPWSRLAETAKFSASRTGAVSDGITASSAMGPSDDLGSSFVFDMGGGGLSGRSAMKGWLLPVAIAGGVLLLLLAAAVSFILLRRRRRAPASELTTPSPPPPPLPEEEPTASSVGMVQNPAHWFENPEDNDESAGTIGEELSFEPNGETGDISMHTRDSSLDDAPPDVLISESDGLFQIDE